MDYKEYLNRIVEFNNDEHLVSLREKYNEPSFFKIISKERSETTYSMFLKWLFHINPSRSNGLSPVLSLLDILVKRSLQQDESLIEPSLRAAIVSRKLKVSNVIVKTENVVSELALDALNSASGKRIAFLNDIVHYCQDRIDVFIQGDLSLDQDKKQLQIIIENKIDSKEGGAKSTGKKKEAEQSLPPEYVAFTKKPQTKRYYEATKQEDNKSLIQLYVYLTPLPSSRLDSFEVLMNEQKQNDKVRIVREDEHFIQINYQDILDLVVTPLLSSSTSERIRFFLEEFKNELAFPNIEGVVDQSCIAIGKDTSKLLTNYWKKYKENLIIPAIIASADAKVCCVDGTYVIYQQRIELFKAIMGSSKCKDICLKEGWVTDNPTSASGYSSLYGDYQFKKGVQYKAIEQALNKDGKTVISLLDPKTEKKNIIDLLKSFIDENGSFLYALMNGIEDSERKKVQCLISLLSKKDSTKYTIYSNDKCIQTEEGYTQTAYNIIKHWATERDSSKEPVTIEKLRMVFPRAINNYYERGKWFNYLIYPFKSDGSYTLDDNVTIVKGNFDFYKKDPQKKHHFTIADKKEVVVLKMWHKEDVESLIKHIEEKGLFNPALEIIRS